MITIHNTHTWQICFKVETSYTKDKESRLIPIGWLKTTTVCNGYHGISVPAFASSTFWPTPGWSGALTLINNGLVGSRFEFTFIEPNGLATAGHTFYDVDMELGISAGTMGPSDHRVRTDGFSQSLAGEANPLDKANQAWLRSPNRWELLRYPKYIVADKGNRLVWVNNDKDSPRLVKAFFQLEANFNAYTNPGSDDKNPPKNNAESILQAAGDKQTFQVDTQAMTITIY
ncbi:MAG: hypothetical protein Q9208_000640 [Pyrenodesmia sp. 3 TL-2023]